MRHRIRTATFDEARMRRIVAVVNKHGGSIAKASRELGLSKEQVNRAVTNATVRGVFVAMVEDESRQRPEFQDKGAYLPSEDEIAAECEVIRGGWTARERYERAKWAFAEWEIPAPGQAFYESVAEAVA